MLEKSISLKSIFKSIIFYLNDHWFFKSLVEIIPPIITFVLAFPNTKGPFFISVNGQMKLSRLGLVMFIIGSGCIIISFFANNYASKDKRNMLSYAAENQIRKNASINEATYEEIKNNKLRRAYGQLAYNENSLIHFLIHYVDPKARTQAILVQIANCIASQCEIDATEVVVSSVVSYKSGDWLWLCYPQIEGRAHLRELLKEGSALYQVINSRTYFYANDKVQAIENKTYLPDRRDKTNNGVGSIICWEVSTEIEGNTDDERFPLRMIISISTYGRKLIETDLSAQKIDEVYKEVIEKMILNQFKGELTENLIWYGLQKLKELI